MHWPLRETTVFISYRRDDSAVRAHSLYLELRETFGKEHVFWDVADIDYGDEFEAIIDRRIQDCDVVVAVIGPQWLTIALDDGKPRIQRSDDYVRREIAAGLRQRKKVIPVLVDGAKVIADESLPRDLAGLFKRNVQTIVDPEMLEGADRLVAAIRGKRARDVITEYLQRTLATRVGLGVALAMVFATSIGFFEVVGLDTRSASITLWLADMAAPPALADELQIVAVDPETERILRKTFARNPATRRDHAQLIRKLAQAGARTVAFDIYFSTPSAAADRELADAIRFAHDRGTAVILGFETFDGDRPTVVPALNVEGVGWAALCVGERLGYASTVPLASGQPRSWGRGVDNPVRAVGIGLAAAYPASAAFGMNARQVIASRSGSVPKEIWFSESEPVPLGAPCQVGRVGDQVAEALVRAVPLAALRDAEHRIGYAAVQAMSAEAMHQRFARKTVLVGLELPGMDEYPVFHGWASETRFGLELHANATSAVLAGGTVRPIWLPGQFAITMATGVFGARLSRWRPVGSSLPRRGVLLAVLLCGAAAAVWLCANHAMLLNLTYPAGALLFGYWLAAKMGLPR